MRICLNDPLVLWLVNRSLCFNFVLVVDVSFHLRVFESVDGGLVFSVHPVIRSFAEQFVATPFPLFTILTFKYCLRIFVPTICNSGLNVVCSLRISMNRSGLIKNLRRSL